MVCLSFRKFSKLAKRLLLGSIVCPRCKTLSPKGTDFSGVPEKIEQIKDANVISCSMCLEEEKKGEAAQYCKQCDEFLCQTCLRRHSKLKNNQMHAIFDLDKIFSEDFDRGILQNGQCNLHPCQEYHGYCSTCYRLICRACVQVHLAHMVIYTDDLESLHNEHRSYLPQVSQLLVLSPPF